MKMRKYKRSFTLIELLVVMLLMGVLVTMMLPAFKRMITGDQVQQLASNLKLGLEQAQSRAVSTRRYVALILPNPKMGKNKDQWLGGCRMAFVEKKRSTVEFEGGKPKIDRKPRWLFKGWVPDTEWKEVNDGAKLLLIAKGTDNPGGSDDYNKFKEGEGLDKNKINNGSNDKGMESLLNIYEYKENTDAAEETVENAAIIFSPYGGIVGKDTNDYGNLRLAIVECIKNGNDLIFPSRDGDGPTNYLVLEINRFTGRVKYYQPPSSWE